MFADVKRRIHHRIEWKEQIKLMEETLNLHFVTYFSNFSLTQLDNVLPFSDEELTKIKSDSGIQKLSLITDADFRKYMDFSIKSHGKMISEHKKNLEKKVNVL